MGTVLTHDDEGTAALVPQTPRAAALCERMERLGREYGPDSAALMADRMDKAHPDDRRAARAAWRAGCAAWEAAR